MSSAVLLWNTLEPSPTGRGWVYSRTWIAVDHPQSYSFEDVVVAQFMRMSEDEAFAEIDRLGLRAILDFELLKRWKNNGSVH